MLVLGNTYSYVKFGQRMMYECCLYSGPTKYLFVDMICREILIYPEICTQPFRLRERNLLASLYK